MTTASDTAAAQAPRSLRLPGDRMPEFFARANGNPRFRFDSVAGRWIVLAVLGSSTLPGVADRVAALNARDELFDDQFACAFLVSQDREDESAGRVVDRLPGRRVFWDDGGAIARLLGALPSDPAAGAIFAPMWLVVDPSLTVARTIPFRNDGGDTAEMIAFLESAPRTAGAWLGFEVPPPILILPDVFEPEFCAHLISLYEAAGGEISGFMREQDGKTVAVHDPGFKVRRDYTIEDQALVKQVQARIVRRVIPQIERVHFFRATRMERYLVACYDAAEGGHFRPHRDNTTQGTAHRRYAVSINLNDAFEGGEVSFPEYAPRGFKAPRGGAVIFSCSMLHAVSRVTSGRRYAFLPFLYDDAAARIREANASNVPSAAGYRA